MLDGLPAFGVPACALFVVCGALRLARFPLVKNPRHFVGLPIPPAGVLVCVLAAAGVPPAPAVAVLLALGALMVGEARFPTLPALLSAGRTRDDRPPEEP